MVHLFTRHRPTAQTRGEDTRRRILETALEVFAAEGYVMGRARATSPSARA